MNDVTIAIPYRATPDREPPFRYVYRQFQDWFPQQELIIADSSHPCFSRSAARNSAVSAASGEVLVICDADTLPQREVLERAIEEARRDNRLHLPYDFYRGLSDESTVAVLDGEQDIHQADTVETGTTSIGGVWVISKQGWWNAGGMDERFLGWGWEDNAFWFASNARNGKSRHHRGAISHLFHPREPGFTETTTYLQNRELYRRYEKNLDAVLSEEGRRL